MSHGKVYILLIACIAILSCSPRAVQEAREVVARADSLRAEGQMYADSARLAQTYETLDAIPFPLREGLGLGSLYAHACYHYGRLLREKDNPVEAMQVSQKAIDLVEANVAKNFPKAKNHRAVTADAFEYLSAQKAAGSTYDLIILDPPAFAKHRDAVKNALRGYQRINAKAIEMIRPGGILFTFSCSQAVDKEAFRLAVFSAAAQVGRKVRILHQLHQPQDHPINIYHPEGEYLKGLILYIE